MVSTGYVRRKDEIEEEFEPAKAPSSYEAKDHISLNINTSQRGLLDEKKHGNKFLDMVAPFPSKSRFVKFGSSNRLSSSSSKFRRIAEERDDSSPGSKRFRVPFVNEINWASLWRMCKEWIRDPLNMALFVWIICVAISGAILFLVMTGMLNGALPRKSQRDTWFEVNNQIINALFTLMCLYQHPKRFHHLVLLCRWRPEDVLSLQKVYCKNGTCKPNERKHMMVVVILLHINCLAQYALCGLNLGYPRSKRPAIGVGLCLSVAIGAPAVAGVYNFLSPLGREYEIEIDQEAQGQASSAVDSKPTHLQLKSLEKRYSFMGRDGNRIAESSPQWVGGLFDFWDDISLAYLSVFCSCCVFGWNMDRLGFGNMYVHISTFLLFCLAPFFIFNLAAVNINNDTIREILGITGFLLCIFGLLYGGFWRIQMRKKFNLPGNTFCCGKPAISDCLQWLFCCSCSLAQEVRTADYYDVVEDKLYLKEMNNGTPLMLSPLPREAGSATFRSSPSSLQGNSNQSLFTMDNLTSPIRSSGGSVLEPFVEEDSSLRGKDKAMKAPIPSVIQREDNMSS